MKEIFVMLNNNIKNLFKNTNLLLLIIICIQLLSIWLAIYIYLELSDGQYHFYMNTKNTIENLYGIKIDKYDGSMYKELSTEQKLIRKQNKKFHLKYLFK